MELIVDDPLLGNGLESRAWQGDTAQGLLNLVIGIQVVIAAFLWVAALAMAAAVARPQDVSLQRLAPALAIGAVTSFAGLWVFFLCGGLWFGYWMKQGPIQMVHMTLLILSIASLFYLAQPSPTRIGAPVQGLEGRT